MSSKKYIPSPGGVLPNGTVYEQIEVNGVVQYAMKTDKGVKIMPFIEVGEHVVYQPLSPCAWMLPSNPIDFGSVQNLWDEVRQFIYDHLDIEDERLYEVMVAWVLVSWITEKFDSVGYLHFHGPRNSGKTRGLDILNYICFRPLESPSATGATVFRALDSFRPTFLLDEFEMYEKMKESKAEVIGILNAGYRRGQVVLRMTGMKEGTPMIKGFKVFGPKALSSIEKLPDALSSRCIRFSMTRTFRKIRRLIDKKRASELRSKLLHYRFGFDLEEEMNENGNPIDLPDGRLIEMFYPLEAVAPTEDIKKTILECALSQYNVSIQEERATRHAQIFHTIIKLLKNYPRLIIPQKEIREQHGQDYLGGESMKYQTLGGLLKTMGFDSVFDNKVTSLVVDMHKLENRKNRYVLAEEMDEVNLVLARVRALKAGQQSLATVATVSTVQHHGGESETVADTPQETQKTVHSVESVNTVVSVETVDSPTVEPNLQEKLEIVLETLREINKPVTEYGIKQKLQWDSEEISKILLILERDQRIGRSRPGYWVVYDI